MNILIVTNNFSKGGLETHIDTMYNALKENNNIYFAISNYKESSYLNGAKIFEDFNFKLDSTIEEFCNDVDNLIKIINEYNIDVIHVHPFYSIFPCIFAANLTKTKLVYTYHGRASLNFINYINEQILYYFGIENVFDKIFCVAEDAIEWFNDFKKEQAIYFPNIIDENKYSKHKIQKNKKWALISRLDIGKVEAIEKFIKVFSQLDIKTLDIYGSGTEEEKLKELVKNLNLDKKIKFYGYKENLYNLLDNNYNGVIGLGRVTLEALTMNYPVILIGYGKICGLIDEKLLQKISKNNFITTNLHEINIKTLNDQILTLNSNIKNYQFREKMIKEYGLSNIKNYLEELNEIEYSNIDVVDSIFSDIKKIKDQNEQFYLSHSVFLLLSRLSDYSKNINLKTDINIYKRMYEMLCSIYNLQDKQNNIEQTSKEFKLLNESLNLEIISLKEENRKTKEELKSLNTKFENLLFNKIKSKLKLKKNRE